jgi:RimK family alpha-L-glutamate ligase
MRIAVLASPKSWYLADLRRAAGSAHELAAVPFSRITSKIGPQGIATAAAGVDLASFDCVLVRTMPPGSLEQVVFRMDALGRLAAAGVPVINSARAIETAVDKFLASARLREAGLCVPRTIACQTADDALAAFAELGGDVVLKPVFGGEGRGIARLNDEALAERAFKTLAQLGAVLYLQEFVSHDGFDVRLLVIGRRVLAMRRRNPLDWRTNVSRGAAAEGFEADDGLVELAHRAAAAVGAVVAGVDVLPGRDGQQYVLEVNAVPGWKALSAALEVDVAALVLEYAALVAAARRRE